jgi:hypothetical protein
VDTEAGIIVDVEATTALRTHEVALLAKCL